MLPRIIAKYPNDSASAMRGVSNPVRTGAIIFTLCLITTILAGQHYAKKQYRIEDGLPTNFIKAITEDSHGNLWIATDEGFVRYNARDFKVQRCEMHSNYTKGFCHTNGGRLLAFGDLDVLELSGAGDSTWFRSLVPVSWSVNDSCLSYPKLFYEDSKGALWVSESQAVVRLERSGLRRYGFTLKDRTPQFLRSFSFFEDNHDLFTVSVAGNVFRYDSQQDSFVKTEYQFPSQVEFVSVLNGYLVIGAASGLYLAERAGDGRFGQPKLTADIKSVSYVAALPYGGYFVATRGTDHFMLDATFGNKMLAVSNVDNINHVYISRENDIWLSTQEGIVLMYEAAFQGPAGTATDLIECITEDVRSSKIYYATRSELHAWDRMTREDKLVIRIGNGYFRSLVSTPQGLWAANAFQVMLISDNKIKKMFDFSSDRMFVTSLDQDVEGNIWLTIPGRRQALMIDPELSLHTVQVPLAGDGFINDVKDGGNGIYALSNGANYLFFKSYQDTIFRDISLPVKFKPEGGLRTYELLVKDTVVWLATSLGLLRHGRKTLERVDFGKRNEDVPVRSICANGDAGMLITSPTELVYYDTQRGNGHLFASARQLSGMAVNTGSTMISRDENVWLGTGRGVFTSSHALSSRRKMAFPRVASVSVDGQIMAYSPRMILPYNRLLSLGITAITFPEEERVFEFRYPGDRQWTRLTGGSIDVITARPGKYDIQVRAIKTGTYEWSDIATIQFTVPRPFWMTHWFYLLMAMALVGIILLTALIMRRLNAQQKYKLEEMVARRTAELDAANRELEGFSYSVSHDLRAPLRLITGFLQIIEEEYAVKMDEEGRKVINSIRDNASRMNQLIDDLLRFARVRHQDLEKSEVNFDEMVREIVVELNAEDYKHTVVNIARLPVAVADRRLIKQVWINLISNGMKYSAQVSSPQVDITCDEQGKELVFCVRDNGAGFDMQYAGKLFGVFQRLHTEKEFPGTGIGLALVRRIVNRHDGRVWAEGRINHGAAFYFTLPRPS